MNVIPININTFNNPEAADLVDRLIDIDSEKIPERKEVLDLCSKHGLRLIIAPSLVQEVTRFECEAIAINNEPLSKDADFIAHFKKSIHAWATMCGVDTNNEKAAEVGEFLIRKLWKAHGATNKITVLRAIENSGYAPAIGAVQRCFDDPDPFVRTAAIRALRPMKDPLLDDVIASRIRSVASAEEKLLLLEVAEGNGPSDTLVGALVDVSGTPDVKVRRQAVGLLAKWAPGLPHLQQVLKKIAEADSDAQVRASARARL